MRGKTSSQIERAQGLAKEGPKGGLALHEYTWNDFRREHLELLDPGESKTTATHWEEARADYNRTEATSPCPSSSFVPSLVHTRTLVVATHVADFPAQKKRHDALGYKPPAG